MTAWALAFGWNWLLVPVVAYLARRFWVASREPGLKYIEHTSVLARKPFVMDESKLDYLEKWVTWLKHPSLRGHKSSYDNREYPKDPPPQPECAFSAHLLTVRRRERFFPWAHKVETWLVADGKATRESDGEPADKSLYARFLGIIAVAEARRLETEELAK